VPSVRRVLSPPVAMRAMAGVAVVAGAGPLAGCATTMQRAARLRLNSARILASQSSIRVSTAGTTVTVTGVTLIRSGRATAFVVTVRNVGRRAISDLPISVGYRLAHHREVYVNAGDTLTYFDAHLPGIAAGASLTWVYTAGRRLPAGARPFARVGSTPAVPGAAVDGSPVIRVRATPATGTLVDVAVRNLSGVPQYQLPVYAVAERDGHAVAAGQSSVTELAGGASQTLQLRLLGRTGPAAVQVEAPSTIFH